MNCAELVGKIEQVNPSPDPLEVLRVATLMCNHVDEIRSLDDDEFFADAWDDVNMRLQAAADQHAAVADELSKLIRSDPAQFTQDQIWILIRAIKVQSQLLRLYVGDASVEIS